jgi:NADH-quinone oxidoreductase subunit L
MTELSAWFIFLLPLASFVLIALGIRPFLGPHSKLAGYLTILAIAGSLGLSFWAFQEVRDAEGHRLLFTPEEWMTVGPLTIEVGLRLDSLAVIMALVVSSVSLVIQIYSLGYMAGDPGFARYYAYMSLFTASMLGLVMADNLLLIFVFWELVGLCSYLLIGFWYQRPSAARAAIKAFVVTRFGDVGFLVAILFAFAQTTTFNLDGLEDAAATGALGGAALTWLAVGVFAGAAGKSAQFPIHVWLPDAMEGPTPVSALIHAATMVAAGVFLVARTFPIFEHSETALNLIASLGAVTAFVAATMGLVMTDIKRVVAYSTISQLGFMMLALGVGAPAAAIFHLFNHAFFKALLFLGSGSVNHATGTFDMRRMGGLRSAMPWTYITFLIAALSLAGIFPLSGFWSKDEMLVDAWDQQKAVFFMALISAFLTSVYIFRVLFLTFEGQYQGGEQLETAHQAHEGGDAPGHPHEHHAPHESPLVMVLPMVVLAVLAIITGFVNPPGFDVFGISTHWFSEFLGEQGTDFNVGIAVVSSIVAVAGIAVAYVIYGARWVRSESLMAAFRPIHTVLVNKYYLDVLYEEVLVRRVFYGTITFITDQFDRLIVDGVVNLSGWVSRNFGRVFAVMQTGQVQAYGAVISLGILSIVLAYAIERWMG